jgi:hypothetical protein
MLAHHLVEGQASTLNSHPGARSERLKSILYRTLRGGLTHNSLNA